MFIHVICTEDVCMLLYVALTYIRLSERLVISDNKTRQNLKQFALST